MIHEEVDAPDPVKIVLVCGHDHVLDSPHRRGERVVWCSTCGVGSIAAAIVDMRESYDVSALPSYRAEAIKKMGPA
jgi:hypothetical protein